MEVKKLKGFLSTNDAVYGDGVTIVRNQKIIDLTDFSVDSWDKEELFDHIFLNLSRIPRYSGNTNKPYFVGQHIWYGTMSYIIMGDIKSAKEFFYHEVAEGFLNDVVTPLKNIIKEQYKKLEYNLEVDILKLVNLTPEDLVNIKQVDKNLAEFEISTMLCDSDEFFDDYWDSEKTYSMLKSMSKTIDLFYSYKEQNDAETNKLLSQIITIDGEKFKIVGITLKSVANNNYYDIKMKNLETGQLTKYNCKRNELLTLVKNNNNEHRIR